MKHSSACRFVLLLGWIWLTVLPLRAEEHRATRLGHPATRFAPPLRTPEDLRARFRDEKLRPDFASVLYQWGWKGDLDDLFRAAAQEAGVACPEHDRLPAGGHGEPLIPSIPVQETSHGQRVRTS